MKMKAMIAALGFLTAVAWTQVVGAGEADTVRKKDKSKWTVVEVLAAVDSNLTSVKDQTYQGHVEVIRDGKSAKSMRFVAKLKGLQKKLIKFTAPGDVRGMAILTTEEGHMYVYIPSYKRVRRVAAHVRNQGFMGTDFSPEEMGAAALSVGWKAKMLEQDDNAWVLELKPEPGTETGYHRLVITVSKEHEGVEKIESYDASRKLIKTQVRTDWKEYGVIKIPTKFTVTDHRTGSSSIMRFSGCTVNEGISDATFTQRALMRGD